MKRKEFVRKIIGTTMIAGISGFKRFTDELPDQDELMPVLFIGHGSPMNAIEDNEFSQRWKQMAQEIPVPNVVLVVSAHWLTHGTQITTMEFPKTIHDFGGFPRKLYDVQYPAPGSPSTAKEIVGMVHSTVVGYDHDWGLDHGAWSVVKQMYPEATIPVLQLSIDFYKDADYHYDLAKELAPLRKKGVLIIGSGNMVHNLGMIHLPDGKFENFNSEFGFDWTLEINKIFKEKIAEKDHRALIHYQSIHKNINLAVPTPDHYFPLLYTLALQEKFEDVTIFNDKAIAGSFTMTSVKIS